METNILSEVREHRIPARNIGKLQDGFAKLAKRAAKLGVTAPTFTEVRVEKELAIMHLTTSNNLLHLRHENREPIQRPNLDAGDE